MRLTTLRRSTALALTLAFALPGASPVFAQSLDKKPGIADPLDQDEVPAVAPPVPPASPAPAAPPAPAAAAAPSAPVPPPTDPDALALYEALAPYVSQPLLDKGVITVAKEGSGFRIGIDAGRLLADVDPTFGQFTISPYTILVAERADGDWDVSANDPLRIDAAAVVEGQRNSLFYDIPESTFTGVWSPALGTFTSGQGRAGGGTVRQDDPTGKSDATFGAITYTTEARPTGVGEADLRTDQTIASMKQTIETQPDPATGMPAMTIGMDMGEVKLTADAKATRTRAILDLWAFAVSRIDSTGDKFKADQEDLRRHLQAVLPLWRNLSGDYLVRDLKVTTPFGAGDMRSAGQTFSFDGISGGGSYTWRFDVEGLNVSSPMAPDWAIALLPQDMRMSFTVRDVDLKTPVDIAIREFDLNNPDIFPASATQAMSASFAENLPTILVDPGHVRGKDYEITYESTIEITGPEKAETRSIVTARGIDAIIANLQKVGTNEAFSAVGGLNFAKGFAETLPDGRLRWNVETKADGAVLVNGNQVVAPDAAATDDGAADPYADDGMTVDPQQDDGATQQP